MKYGCFFTMEYWVGLRGGGTLVLSATCLLHVYFCLFVCLLWLMEVSHSMAGARGGFQDRGVSDFVSAC